MEDRKIALKTYRTFIYMKKENDFSSPQFLPNAILAYWPLLVCHLPFSY